MGFLLLNPRKEVIVLTKKLLDACPAVALKPSPPAEPVKPPTILSRKCFNAAYAIVKRRSGLSTASKGLLVLNAMHQLGMRRVFPRHLSLLALADAM